MQTSPEPHLNCLVKFKRDYRNFLTFYDMYEILYKRYIMVLFLNKPVAAVLFQIVEAAALRDIGKQAVYEQYSL